MRISFRWFPYRYFPYEKALAQRELHSLYSTAPTSCNGSLSIQAPPSWQARAHRTTYFSRVTDDRGNSLVPLQAKLESSVLPEGDPNSEPRSTILIPRQRTRYSAHGLHEYRGKFNPQLVRSIGNILDLRPGAWLLDPFCGSGTTLIEAMHCGWNSVGFDLNPLAVSVANAKVSALTQSLAGLKSAAEILDSRLSMISAHFEVTHTCAPSRLAALRDRQFKCAAPAFDYLQSWFTKPVLAQLLAIMREIGRLPHARFRPIANVILSDLLRSVSLQDPADLRIRRRKTVVPNQPLIPRFLQTLRRRILTITSARRLLGEVETRNFAIHADSRRLRDALEQHRRRRIPTHFDAVITSPPYATALPYIDTQRLSLVALGLADPHDLKSLEQALVGSREISNSERALLERAIHENSAELPHSCIKLCRQLLSALSPKRDGFRKRNVPALIYRYLSDMAMTLRETHCALRAGGSLAIVIGRNRTRLGSQDFEIDSSRLLRELAVASGFSFDHRIKLNAYPRYDMHRVNSIRSEDLVLFHKR